MHEGWNCAILKCLVKIPCGSFPFRVGRPDDRPECECGVFQENCLPGIRNIRCFSDICFVKNSLSMTQESRDSQIRRRHFQITQHLRNNLILNPPGVCSCERLLDLTAAQPKIRDGQQTSLAQFLPQRSSECLLKLPGRFPLRRIEAKQRRVSDLTELLIRNRFDQPALGESSRKLTRQPSRILRKQKPLRPDVIRKELDHRLNHVQRSRVERRCRTTCFACDHPNLRESAKYHVASLHIVGRLSHIRSRHRDGHVHHDAFPQRHSQFRGQGSHESRCRKSDEHHGQATGHSTFP